MNHYHDTFYREFFSDPDLVRQLIEDFLPSKVVNQLDISQLERVETSFIGEHDQVRESDLIWKVYFQNGRPLYLYLLLEFQSSPDTQMPLRLLEYITLLYRQLIKSGEVKPTELPPVMPVVIYNGNVRWMAPTSLDQMIQAPDFIRTWQPRFEFLLLDEGAFSSAQLEKLGSAVALLFEAEQAQNREQLQRVYPKFLAALKQLPNYESIRRIVGRWILRSVKRKLGDDAIIQQGIREEFDMLAENLPRILEQERQQGIEKGMRIMVIGMHRSGMSIETIAQISGQDVEVIKRWILEAEKEQQSSNL